MHKLDLLVQEEINRYGSIINDRQIVNPHLLDGIDTRKLKKELKTYNVYEDFRNNVRNALDNPLFGWGFFTDRRLSEMRSELRDKARAKQPVKTVEKIFLWKKYESYIQPLPNMENLDDLSLIKLINEEADQIEREIKREIEFETTEEYTTAELNSIDSLETQQDHTTTELSSIDSMDGYAFEGYMKNLFEEMGYMAEQTKLSGDMGADLILWEGNNKIVVQLKNHTEDVGIRAIQEVVAAVNYYEADEAMVVITSNFTQSAIELAGANDVKLIDRDDLDEWITQYDYP